ncbi:MAG: chromosome condensation regulator RCC1 [Cystobacter sp.]
MRINFNSWRTALVLLSTLGVAGCSPEAPEVPGDDAPPVDVPVETADTRAPRVTLLSPRESSRVALARFQVEGTVEEESGVAELRWRLNDGEPVALDPARAVLDFELQPRPGLNRLVVSARDTLGNAAETSVSFTFGNQTGAGGLHGGAVRDGVLYTWGRNNRGQLGLGDTVSHRSPTKVEGLPEVAAIAFGQNNSLAVGADGSVWTWGDNASGQLGLADKTMRQVPTRVPGISDAVAATVGYTHMLVLHRDGHLSAFGKNNIGQLGDGTTLDRSVPVPVVGLTDVVRVIGGSQHSAAVRRDGTVWVWGRNRYGNLGLGTPDDAPHATPTLVPGLTGVVDLANGRDHLLALHRDGTLSAWGLNASGQLGDGQVGNDDQRNEPVRVEGIRDATAVFAQGTMSFAQRRDGTLWGWGENNNGQLGTGDTTGAAVPTLPVQLRMAPSEPLTGLNDVSPGATHVIARHSDGTLFAWGWSLEGSLGGGTDLFDQWTYPLPLRVVLP